MRDLQARLVTRPDREAAPNRWRGAFFFLASFAVFLAALILLPASVLALL